MADPKPDLARAPDRRASATAEEARDHQELSEEKEPAILTAHGFDFIQRQTSKLPGTRR